MFCSNDTDLNNYFKRQEATEARYEAARARAMAEMCYSEIDGGEVLWAVEQFDKGLMTAEQGSLGTPAILRKLWQSEKSYRSVIYCTKSF
jgi:hypothetical protein